MTIASRLADFCQELQCTQLPSQVDRRTRELIVDFAGVALAGSLLASSRTARGIHSAATGGGAVVIGTHLQATAPVAALLNGTAAHGTELDDVTRESSLHPGVAVIPAALAISEYRDATLNELARAVAAGYEVTIRIGNALGGSASYKRGFHPTGVAGTFGAAIAAGVLLGLKAEALTRALGVAGTVAAGSLEYLSDGSWTKRLNAGWAAHSGILAAELAAAGFTGPTTVFEGRHGTLRAYTDDPAPERALAGLGEEFMVMKVGLKAYACCRYNHAIIDAVLQIRSEGAISPEDIASIRLGVLSAGALLVAEPIEQKRRPHNIVDAQFSAPYAAAVAIVYGAAGVEQYTEGVLADPRVSSLMAITSCERDSKLDALYPEAWPAWVEIVVRDGRQFRREVNYATGEPENWLPRSRLLEKFNGLSRGTPGAQEFARLVLNSESDVPVRAVAHLLADPSVV